MPKESEILFYQTGDGNIKIDVHYLDETFWMTQKKISDLFGVYRPAVTKHLKNIFKSRELVEDSVSSILELSDFPILQDKGKISALEAKLKAEKEFGKFRKIQDKNYISDFDTHYIHSSENYIRRF